MAGICNERNAPTRVIQTILRMTTNSKLRLAVYQVALEFRGKVARRNFPPTKAYVLLEDRKLHVEEFFRVFPEIADKQAHVSRQAREIVIEFRVVKKFPDRSFVGI